MKTTYKLDELDQAVEQLYRLRLLHNWTGCLKLESNGKKLIISQFPSPSNWTQGFDMVYMIEDWFVWGELDGFYERPDGMIEIESYESNTGKGQYYEHATVHTKKEAFEILKQDNFFEDASCQAHAALSEILAAKEMQEELEA
jgi:hypothetical protein